MGIFKAYDIRGIYPDELDDDTAYKIGRAFVTHTKARQVMVGRDTRNSSPRLHQALIKGVTDQGADVVDIGVATTPMTNFLHSHKGYETSIQVTASHNPKEYGGFKLNTRDAEPLTGDEGIPAIQALVEKNEFPALERKGTVTERDHLEDYATYIAGLAERDLTDLDVIVDASNGPVSLVAEKVLKKLDITYTPLNFTPDGDFPGHDPNPLKGDAPDQAKAKVKETGADFGCLFDADADRAVFVDERGETISPDLIGAVLASHALKQYPGDKVLYDCFSSHVVKDAVEKAGGKGIVMRTGRSYIYQRARAEDVAFAAEASSHYYYREVYHGDHGLLTLLKVMEIVANMQKPLSEIVKEYDTYTNTGQINVPVKGDAKQAIEKVAATFQDGEQSRIDGITIEYPDAWLIARPSNTEPLIRLRVESKDKEKVEELKQRVMEVVQ